MRSVTVAMVAAVLAMGCAGRTAPASLWIDPGLTAEQRAVLDDALDAWCEAADWCPTIVADRDQADAPIGIVDDFDDRWAERTERNVQAWNDGTGVRIAPRAGEYGLDALWHTLAHELGHFCIDQHTGTPAADNLMAETVAVTADGEWLLSTAIDATAVEAWRAGCGIK